MVFEANKGQTDASVRFLARGSGYGVFLTGDEAVLALTRTQSQKTKTGTARTRQYTSRVLRMKLVGANKQAAAQGVERAAMKVNYYIGGDSRNWRTDVGAFEKVRYSSVYPGVDLVYYGNQNQLEYDFVVKPGADPSKIALSFQGQQNLAVDAEGALVLQTPDGDVRQAPPVIYQENNGVREPVKGRFVAKNDHQVGFELGAYDRTRALVIDPTVVFSTFLGGNGEDRGTGITVDAAGNSYVTGLTYSANFPRTIGATTQAAPYSDLFVTKFSSVGAGIYSTYLGGSNYEDPGSIVVDSAGQAIVTGSTQSGSFTTTAGAYPTTVGAFQRVIAGGWDGVLTRLTAAGALQYSSYLGGNNDDRGYDVAVDANNNAYITGRTKSPNFPYLKAAAGFPASANGFQTTPNSGAYDAFLVRISMDGATTSPFTTGISGINNDLADIKYYTYFGAYQNDEAFGLVNYVNPQTSAVTTYIAGYTTQPNNPNGTPGYVEMPLRTGAVQPNRTGAQNTEDGFVAAFNTFVTGSGSGIRATFVGGSAQDRVQDIGVNGAGAVYVTGLTASSGSGAGAVSFPVSHVAGTAPVPFNNGYGGGTYDGFLSQLGGDLTTRPNSTFLGGSGEDVGNGISVDPCNYVHVIGRTASAGFPTLNPVTGYAANADIFVAKFDQVTYSTVYSTHFGGTNYENGSSIATDMCGIEAVFTGWSTSSTNYPRTNAVQNTYGGGTVDAIVTKFGQGPDAPTAVVDVRYGDDDGELVEEDPAGTATLECTGPTTDFTLDGRESALQTTGIEGPGLTYRWCENGQLLSTEPTVFLSRHKGTYHFILTVTAPNGEADCEEQTVIIQDTTPPDFTADGGNCPEEVSTTTDPGQCYAVLDDEDLDQDPVAIDVCSENVTYIIQRYRRNPSTEAWELEYEAPSNPSDLDDPYNEGATLIRYIANDNCRPDLPYGGNLTGDPAVAPSSSVNASGATMGGDCYQLVLVDDDEAPVFTGGLPLYANNYVDEVNKTYDLTGDGVADNVITTGTMPDEVTGTDANYDTSLTDRSISIRVDYGDVLDDKPEALVREVDADDCDLSFAEIFGEGTRPAYTDNCPDGIDVSLEVYEGGVGGTKIAGPLYDSDIDEYEFQAKSSDPTYYTLKWTVDDGSDNTATTYNVLQIKDEVAPTLVTDPDNEGGTYTVNLQACLDAPTYADNCDDEVTISAFAIGPNGEFEELVEDDGGYCFTPTSEGVWEIMWFGADANNNVNSDLSAGGTPGSEFITVTLRD